MKRWSSLVVGGFLVAIVAMVPVSLAWKNADQYKEVLHTFTLGLESVQNSVSASIGEILSQK